MSTTFNDNLKHKLAKYLSTFGILKSYFVLFMDLAIALVMTLVTLLVLEPAFDLEVNILLIARTAAASLCAAALSFWLLRTYRRIIRHTTMRDLLLLAMACIVKEGIELLLFFIPVGAYSLLSSPTPAVYFVAAFIEGCFTFVALVLVRVLMIVTYDRILNNNNNNNNNNNTRLLIYGVGRRAYSMLSLLTKGTRYKVCGFLNYDSSDKGLSIMGHKVWPFETIEELEKILSVTHCGYILFPALRDLQKEQDRIVEIGHRRGVKMLIAPNLDNVSDAGGHMKLAIREMKIEDLLGRDEIQIDQEEVRDFFFGKCVLVTGAAGSIGSELCRQLAKAGVSKLVLFDNAETPMHDIRLEMEEKYTKTASGKERLKLVPVIGDVRYPDRLKMVFERHHPDIVFHAAAYKHVPLMEENPCEAILVNVIGSRNVADFCVKYGVSNMIMISTDKAVNPTNIMGCSKRLAEIYVQSLGLALAKGEVKGTTKFVTTRFGNVLGSNGSVIPRFREQIESGGPVTVTHPDITRFFMTIPEACRLVMEAATMSAGNQIFVFDMGRSVKIADLAKRMIELAGLKEGEDIQIEYTGLRPGEKLYEEVLANTENTDPTSHDRIRIAKVREYDYADASKAVDDLAVLSKACNVDELVKLMKRIVPEFKSRNSRFEALDK